MVLKALHNVPSKQELTSLYEVIFSDEVGTLWWHAHSDWSRATVHGAIVISPLIRGTYPFPWPADEFVIVLGKFCFYLDIWIQYIALH